MRIAVIHHTDGTESDYGFYISELLSEYATWLGYEVSPLAEFVSKYKNTPLPENAVIGIDVSIKSGFGLRWWYKRKLPQLLAKIDADAVVSLNAIYCPSVKQPQLLAIPDTSYLLDNRKANIAAKQIAVKNLQLHAQQVAAMFTYSQHAAGAIQKTLATNKPVAFIQYCGDKEYKVWEWYDKTLTRSEHSDNKEYFIAILDDNNTETWLTVLKAFSKFKKWQQSSMKLFLLPRHKTPPVTIIDKIGSYKYRDDVKIPDEASEKERATLMGSAYALVHLPANDADLLPLAQALECAIPVITIPGESINEYCADTSLMIEHAGPEELGDMLTNIYKNEEQRSNIVQATKDKASSFSRNNIAKSLWEMIEAAVKSSPAA